MAQDGKNGHRLWIPRFLLADFARGYTFVEGRVKQKVGEWSDNSPGTPCTSVDEVRAFCMDEGVHSNASDVTVVITT